MFQALLEKLVNPVPGCTAGVIMGLDGIPIHHYIREKTEPDVEVVGAELTVLLKETVRAAEMLRAGKAHQLTLKTTAITTLASLLTEEYFVALLVKPEGYAGKASYQLRLMHDELVQALQG